MGTWCNGITSASHAESTGFKSQCVHFVTHIPKVAPELRARIPAALSCTIPLTQSLQPTAWHSDPVHIGAQALATTILKCMVWMNLILTNTLAERSKAVAQGAIPKGRGFEPHRCHFIWFGSSPWCAAYMVRPVRPKGTCNFRAMSLLHQLLPCTDHVWHISVSFSKGPTSCAVAKGSIGCISSPEPAAGLEVCWDFGERPRAPLNRDR
jgi:hypothetical protein